MPYKDKAKERIFLERRKPIKAAYDRDYYQSNREAKDATVKARTLRNPEERREYIRAYKDLAKREAFDHYGWNCSCCGLSTPEFLSIDHIAGGGSAHRKEIKQGSIFAWLRKHNYPSGFRTLCFNCNLAVGFFGYCPHASPHLAIVDKASAKWRRFRHDGQRVTRH